MAAEKILYIVRGVPGSGKTSWSKECLAYWRGAGLSTAHYEADMWMCDSDGNYKFDGSRLAECHQNCQRMVNVAMMGGTHRIFVANTFVKRWEADVYYTLAKLWGYRVVVYRMNGTFENVHGVPQDRVNIMKANMEVYPGEIHVSEENRG